LREGIYDPNLALMKGVKSTSDRYAATGFIRLTGVRLKVGALPKHG